jgi:hypothetical protein
MSSPAGYLDGASMREGGKVEIEGFYEVTGDSSYLAKTPTYLGMPAYQIPLLLDDAPGEDPGSLYPDAVVRAG